MTDTASAAQSEREQFERHVTAYTGRDMEYHERNGTTGLEFGWACWQAARRAQPTPPAVVEPLTDEQISRIARSVLEAPATDGVAPAWELAVCIARAIEAAHGVGLSPK